MTALLQQAEAERDTSGRSARPGPAGIGLTPRAWRASSWTEQDLRELIRDVGTGRLGRREFLQSMLGRGLTALAAAQMLTSPRPTTAQPTSSLGGAARRGGGGTLRLIAAQPQTPTQLNPHLSIGADTAVRLFYEPLAAFDPDANLVPVLAAEIPSVENGDARQGRHLGDLAPQARGRLARRAALHRGRRDLHLALLGRPRHRHLEHDALPGAGAGRAARGSHCPHRLPGADPVLVRDVLRRLRVWRFPGTSSTPTAARGRGRRRGIFGRWARAPTGS